MTLLQTRSASEMASVRRQILSDLRYLAQKVSGALKDLEEGRPLDEHLIVNASGISAYIARYNLLTDLLPYINEPP